jgi:DNA-binding MarR family transcriptional regulator
MKSTTKLAGPRPGFDSLEQEVFLQLWRTYDCLKAVEGELFGQYDLSAQQYNALRLLQSTHPDAMQTIDLGKRLISRGPDTTRLLDRLQERGLIARTRHPANRRVVQIVITPAGLALLDAMAGAVLQMHQLQLGHLSPAKQRRLSKLLKLARLPHEDATCDWLDD